VVKDQAVWEHVERLMKILDEAAQEFYGVS